MGRKLPHTPVSQIKGSVRNLTLRCRERQAALKAASRTCSCGAKHSVAKGREVKVEAHHRRPPNWERVIAAIREELLPPPEQWEILCEACHDKRHGAESRVKGASEGVGGGSGAANDSRGLVARSCCGRSTR